MTCGICCRESRRGGVSPKARLAIARIGLFLFPALLTASCQRPEKEKARHLCAGFWSTPYGI